MILIILFALVAVFAVAFAAYSLSLRFVLRSATKFRALCVVKSLRRTRVPGLWRAVVEYVGRDRARHVASTRCLPLSKLPVSGAKRYCTVCRVGVRGKAPLYWVELKILDRD